MMAHLAGIHVGCLLAILLDMGDAAAQQAWKTYKNERFGTTIEYPADKFIPQPPPKNKDALRFITTDGAEFTVSAINNVLNQNLAAIERSALKDRPLDEKITHRDRGPNWIVLSGTKANVIFYERYLLSHRGKIVNDFEILYPVRLRSLYDPIVTRMSKSFRAGMGIDTGPP
jgi:glutathione peroxidase-family protein